MSVVRWVKSPALALVAFALACAEGPDPAPPGGTVDGAVAPPEFPLEEPASWRGVLPCVDCPGIRTTLTLRPDGTYRRLDAHLGVAVADGDTLSGALGRWHHGSDGTRVVLVSGSTAGSDRFRIRDDGALELAGPEGDGLETGSSPALSPVPLADHEGDPLEITGAFTYFADAALLTTCGAGIQLPVAMESAYLRLERAYAQRVIDAGDPMVVRVRGRVESRPAMDSEDEAPTLIVSSFELAPTYACAAVDWRRALARSPWRLIWLDGAEVSPDTGEGAPTLSWDREASRISGFAGCNQYAGRGFLRGTLMITQSLAATRRSCEGSMSLEERYLDVLEEGGAWLPDGEAMVLYQGPLARARFVRAPEG